MGSTGHGFYKKSITGNVNTETFDVENAVNFKGKVPEHSGLDKPGNQRITLKLQSANKTTTLFQFRITKNDDALIMTGYRNSRPEVKSRIHLDATRPSIDRLLKSSSRGDRTNAEKMKKLMQDSSEIDDDTLLRIAQKLIKEKGRR